MNKKNTRALASATVVALVLATGISGTNVKAAAGKIDLVGGADRYATSAEVAKTNWAEGAQNVIIASGENYADALSASVLAKKLDAPILLTRKGQLEDSVKGALKKLSPKNVFILGSEGAISKNVANEVGSAKVTRLQGKDRFATNIAIANYLVENEGVDASDVLVVNGEQAFSDGLSVAPIAAAKEKLLLMVSNDLGDAKAATKFVKDHKSKVTVIGNKAMVPASVYSALNAQKRVEGGHDRFETNLNILKAFNLEEGKKMYFANAQGDKFPDALVASALAGKFNSPLVLVNGQGANADGNAVNYVKDHADKNTDLQALGSKAVIPDALVEKINNAANPKVEELSVESIEAVNAKEMNVKFNKAIDKSTILNDDNTVKDNIVLTLLDEAKTKQSGVKGRVSQDGKVLTLVASNKFEAGKYLVEGKDIKSKVEKEEKAETIKPFNKIIEVKADTVRPTIVGTEKINAGKINVKFSEPIKELGTASFKYADGTSIEKDDIKSTLTNDGRELELELGKDIKAGKDIVATFIGTKDFAGNLISPTPATVKFRKGEKDGVAPKVTDIKVLSSTKFEVKFSEELLMDENLKVEVSSKDGEKIESKYIKSVQDSKDKTKYICTIEGDKKVEGLAKVVVEKGYQDLSGQESDKNYSKFMNFTIKEETPKVTSTEIIKHTDKDVNGQYLQINFDRNVSIDSKSKLTVNVKGTHVKDYVTTSINKEIGINELKSVEKNEKALCIKVLDMANLLGVKDEEGGVYNLTIEGIKTTASKEDLKVSFTRGIDGKIAEKIGKPGIKSVEQDSKDKNKVVAIFDKELDGKTATDVNNYNVEGATIEKAILRSFDETAKTQKVELMLKADSNTFNGERYITISGVKAKGGEEMVKFHEGRILKENVRPTVKDAKLTESNKLTLTFSEDIKTIDDKDDFEVYVGKDKLQNIKFKQVIDGKTVTITMSDKDSKFTAEQLDKGIVIKPAKGNDVVDSNGNALNFTSIKVVK